MTRNITCILTMFLNGLLATAAIASEEASFGGMVVTRLTEKQVKLVEMEYGEPCGVYVKAVEPMSLAGRTGVRPGDILISVKMPGDEEFYPIPPDWDDMAAFCEETRASDKVRLLILRKEGDAWKQVDCRLGAPLAKTKPKDSGDDSEGKGEGCVVNSKGFSFASGDPKNVVEKALDGSPLTRRDVDIFGSVMAWSFGARLTEQQKVVVRNSLIESWSKLPSDQVQPFRKGVLGVPDMLSKLPADKREQLRVSFAAAFLQTAEQTPNDPLARLVRTISGNTRNIVAGAGTDAELSQQDVDALLEYLAFRTQIQTGRPVTMTVQQRAAFTKMVVAHYEEAGGPERKQLSLMDRDWGRLRAHWAAAQAAQQQALTRQWQQAYAQRQVAASRPAYPANWYNTTPSGTMSQGSFDAVMNSMNATHDASMQTLGAIDGGYDTSVYDSAGDWLYDY